MAREDTFTKAILSFPALATVKQFVLPGTVILCLTIGLTHGNSYPCTVNSETVSQKETFLYHMICLVILSLQQKSKVEPWRQSWSVPDLTWSRHLCYVFVGSTWRSLEMHPAGELGNVLMEQIDIVIET